VAVGGKGLSTSAGHKSWSQEQIFAKRYKMVNNVVAAPGPRRICYVWFEAREGLDAGMCMVCQERGRVGTVCRRVL
jgi:hypothetical protein